MLCIPGAQSDQLTIARSGPSAPEPSRLNRGPTPAGGETDQRRQSGHKLTVALLPTLLLLAAYFGTIRAMRMEQFESLKRYVGFDESAARALVAFHPLAERSFDPLIDDFYDTIEQHPEASAAIRGGVEQVNRLKRTLVQWLHSVLLGPHDVAYLEAHSRIGRVHVRIDLPQQFMFSAMNRIRSGLLDTVHTEVPSAERPAVAKAVNQVLDLELAIMLDTYREDWESRVRAGERLATIGQLAASIGHELRNPLGIVESSLYLLRARLDKVELRDPVLDKHLGRISDQVQACANTISSLLDLARDTPPRRKRSPLAVLLQESLDSLALPSEVRVELDAAAELEVWADPQQLKQVLSNLISNAVQAMQGRGHLQLSARTNESGAELLLQDDGPGIAPDHRNRIFEVLFTTRSHGTGLGLALCRKIIERHEGELTLYDSGKPGACFRLWLPAEPPSLESPASNRSP